MQPGSVHGGALERSPVHLQARRTNSWTCSPSRCSANRRGSTRCPRAGRCRARVPPPRTRPDRVGRPGTPMSNPRPWSSSQCGAATTPGFRLARSIRTRLTPCTRASTTQRSGGRVAGARRRAALLSTTRPSVCPVRAAGQSHRRRSCRGRARRCRPDWCAAAYACVNCGAKRLSSDASFLVRPDFTMKGLINPAVYWSDVAVSPGWNACTASSMVKIFVPLARSS